VTSKQRMLAVLRGAPVDRIPWAPRLDLWYNANRLAGTLPDRFRKATLCEIVEEMGWGYHGVVPAFRDLRSPEDDMHRPLGVYNLGTMPYQTVFENVGCERRVEGDRTIVEYDTPKGPLRTVTLYDDTMRKAGVSITHVEEYVFKSPEDYEPLGWLFENARVMPQYEGYERFADEVGDLGLAMAFVSLAASPVHLMQRELMRLDTFFYEMHDRPDQVAGLSEQIGRYWQQVLDVVVDCPAEVVFVGANYDASVQYPPFFEEHIQPWLKRYADALHARDKFLLTHTDGENTGLLTRYLETGIDIADSICPAPMTKLGFKEARDVFGGRITIMGGVPSVALLPSSVPDNQFAPFLDSFFEEIGRGDHLILGISDTTPPAASWERLVEIGRRAEAFGRVPGDQSRLPPFGNAQCLRLRRGCP